jgi:hypothetical protein
LIPRFQGFGQDHAWVVAETLEAWKQGVGPRLLGTKVAWKLGTLEIVLIGTFLQLVVAEILKPWNQGCLFSVLLASKVYPSAW